MFFSYQVKEFIFLTSSMHFPLTINDFLLTDHLQQTKHVKVQKTNCGKCFHTNKCTLKKSFGSISGFQYQIPTKIYFAALPEDRDRDCHTAQSFQISMKLRLRLCISIEELMANNEGLWGFLFVNFTCYQCDLHVRGSNKISHNACYLSFLFLLF